MMTLTHNDVPKVLGDVLNLLNELNQKINSQTETFRDEAMSLGRVVEIDPLNRAKSTFYSYTQNPNSGFPFHKQGKHIIVFRSEFDAWLRMGKSKTEREIQKETDNLLSRN